MNDVNVQPEGRIWLLVILVLLVFAGALIYFTRNNQEIADYGNAILTRPSESRQARLYTVYYNTGVFSPTNIRIHAGDSVKFQNDSDGAVHIISDKTNNIPDLVGFDSIGDVPPGGSFTYTFIKAGTFGYNNSKVKNERGTIIVRP